MRAAGAANHQFHREKDLCRGGDDAVVGFLDAFKEEGHGAAGELYGGLRDGGERRADDSGEIEFIKTDQGYVFRYAYLFLGEALQHEA